MKKANLSKHDILNERGWKCECCGTKRSNDYEIHHCLFHRMKNRPELDEVYNLMVICKRCHKYANAYWFRCFFWNKQIYRYGEEKMMEWYNRVRVADKPRFWKGQNTPYSYKEIMEFYLGSKNFRESP